MKQKIISKIGSIYYLLGRFYGLISKKRSNLFFFFPLSSIGGAELVHLDIVRAFKEMPKDIVIWYRHNPWQKNKSNLDYALENDFKQLGKLEFIEDKATGRYIEWNKKFWQGYYLQKINKPGVSVFIRNGDEDFKAMLGKQNKKKFKLFVVTHNAYSELSNADQLAKYLDVDIQSCITKRILITDSLATLIDNAAMNIGQLNKVPYDIIYNAVTIPKQLIPKETQILHILFAARDVYEKRFSLAYQIAKSINNVNVHFHFAGPDPLNYQGLENATFYGEIRNQEEMSKLYQKCHIFLLTSLSEGFPRSIAEAMGSGEIIITTNVGSIKDHINMQNGLLISGQTDNQIINEVTAFINELLNSKGFISKISETNRSYALANFGYNNFNQKYRDLLSLEGNKA